VHPSHTTLEALRLAKESLALTKLHHNPIGFLPLPTQNISESVHKITQAYILSTGKHRGVNPARRSWQAARYFHRFSFSAVHKTAWGVLPGKMVHLYQQPSISVNWAVNFKSPQVLVHALNSATSECNYQSCINYGLSSYLRHEANWILGTRLFSWGSMYAFKPPFPPVPLLESLLAIVSMHMYSMPLN